MGTGVQFSGALDIVMMSSTPLEYAPVPTIRHHRWDLETKRTDDCVFQLN